MTLIALLLIVWLLPTLVFVVAASGAALVRTGLHLAASPSGRAISPAAHARKI